MRMAYIFFCSGKTGRTRLMTLDVREGSFVVEMIQWSVGNSCITYHFTRDSFLGAQWAFDQHSQ